MLETIQQFDFASALDVATKVIAATSVAAWVIAKATKNTKDDKVAGALDKVLRLLNFFALNPKK